MNALCTMAAMDFAVALVVVMLVGTAIAVVLTAVYVIYANALRRSEGRAVRDAWRARRALVQTYQGEDKQ